jgi:ribosomal protein L37AE/L43A
MVIVNSSVCPECFSKRFYQLKDKSWKCLACGYKYKKEKKNES